MFKKIKIPDRIRDRFRFGTLSFLFIIVYVNLFPRFLGSENSIVAVIFAILMSASMVRDLTATPLRHLIIQSAVLVWMAVAAFLVTTLPAPFSLFINFTTLAAILYTYTYEYSTHMYFPYILAYLFLIFISPVNAAQLPGRIAAMVVGAVSILIYQWVMGRNRLAETARDVLNEMAEITDACIRGKISGADEKADFDVLHHKLCSLVKLIYDRRKRVLCVSEAGFAVIDAGRGLEHLLLMIQQLPPELSEEDKNRLSQVRDQLHLFRDYLHQDIPDLAAPDPAIGESYYKLLSYIRDRLLHMAIQKNRCHYHPTVQSLKMRIQAAMDLSPVRAAYAVRTALLLSSCTLLVQALSLPHGKWLLFTLASVSLPYADDVPAKIKKRIAATVAGGLISLVAYSLIPSPAGRTAVMMLSGYLSFYFNDYTGTFACSTIGAIGGALFLDAFGFQAVGSIIFIRLGYILAGAGIGYAANCLILPFRRAEATRQIREKYRSFMELLAEASHRGISDSQMYYHLVIQAHLMEEKLAQEQETISFQRIIPQDIR